MRKRKISLVTVGFFALVLLVLALLLRNTLRRSSHITLPDTSALSSESGTLSGESGDSLIRIEVTPETVQAAIATLHRPERYIRSITVEQIWSGGSGTQKSTVSVFGGWTRTDTQQADGRTRHALTDGQATYIWYDTETSYFTGQAGDISADDEQRIPTYEEILDLPVSEIETADYRTFSEENCIFVETAADGEGTALRYWVSVESGLLIGAEKLSDGQAVYRMAALPVQDTVPSAGDFTLPDGTVLPQN